MFGLRHFIKSFTPNENDFGLQTDDDNHCRYCRIDLRRRSLLGLGHHWGLEFQWSDRDLFYEANDQNGILMPHWEEGKPRGFPNSLTVYVGSGEFSPAEVNKMAKRNRLNGAKYILTKVNCQHWAVELADALGLTIPIKPNDSATGGVPVVSEVADIAYFVGKEFGQNSSLWNNMGSVRNPFYSQ